MSSPSEQLELLSDFALPLREDLVAIVREKAFAHTGRFLTRDVELCREVCADLIRGMSTRQVAHKYRVSRNSLASIRSILAERGELEPLIKTIRGMIADCVCLGLETYRDALALNAIPATQLPVPLGILTDKLLALDMGLASGRAEQKEVASVEEIVARLEGLKLARVRSVKTVEQGRDEQGRDQEAGGGDRGGEVESLSSGPEENGQ